MLKETYCYLFISQLLTLTYLTAGGWVSTFPVTQQYSDNGRTGTCTYTTNGDFDCPFKLVKNESTSSGMMTLSNNRFCNYYRKMSVDVCYVEHKPAGVPNWHGEYSCIRRKVYYYMKQNCFNNWLSWEACDKACDGGKTKRYRFLTFKTYTTQSKSCNTYPCPDWSPWTKASESCTKNCTQKYNRNCIENGIIVDPKKCATIESGYGLNLAMEYRPCSQLECQIFKKSERKEIDILPGTHIATTHTEVHATTQTGNILPKYVSTNKIKSTDVTFNSGNSQEKTSSLWMGICIGIVVVVVVVLIFTLFRCYKTNWSNISLSNVHFRKSSRNDSTITGTTTVAARSRRNTSSSSFERWFRRTSGNGIPASPTHVADPLTSRSSPGQLYLLPNVSHAFQQQSNSVQESVPLQTPTTTVDVAQYQTHFQSATQTTIENNPSIEPIYADIPGHQHPQIDDFISDSDFDSIDGLDEQVPSMQTRPLPEPIVFRNEARPLSHKIERSATEKPGHRLYTDVSHSKRFPKHRKRSLGYQRDALHQEQDYSHINQTNQPLGRLQERSSENLGCQPGSQYNDLKQHGFRPNYKSYSLRQSAASFQNTTYLEGRTFREPSISDKVPKQRLSSIPADESDYNFPVDRIHTPEDDYDTYNLPYQPNAQ